MSIKKSSDGCWWYQQQTKKHWRNDKQCPSKIDDDDVSNENLIIEYGKESKIYNIGL